MRQVSSVGVCNTPEGIKKNLYVYSQNQGYQEEVIQEVYLESLKEALYKAEMNKKKQIS